jgi:large subunit ribosomal protein L25
MEKLLLKADRREATGKGAARSLRRAGELPAVVYSKGDSMPVKVNAKEVTRMIMRGAGEHALITLQVNEDGGSSTEHPVLIKDYQVDPVSDELLHVDFMQVSLSEKITVTVPLHMIKEPSGVKMGGILEFHTREVEVECLPTQIPEKIDIDAESVGIGHSFHVSDIAAPEGVRIVTDPEDVILTVSAPRVEEAPAEEAAEEAAEPEVVKAKGKEEEKAEEPGKKEE